MAILIRCSCKTELKLSAKKCHKCGNPIPAKGRTYRVVLRAGGHKVTRTVTNLALAREIEAKLKMEIQRGEHDLKRKKPAPTLNAVWTKYLAWAKENKKSWRTDFYYYREHLEPAFGLKSLEAISPFDIEKFLLSLKKGLNKRGRPFAPATIKHQIVLLSRLYSLAGLWGLYSGPNPCKQVKKPRLNNQVTEYLTDAQLDRLLKVLDAWPDPMTSALVRFALYTGLRRSELFNLTWPDVDLQARTVTVRKPKGGKDAVLPLSSEAVAVLDRTPRDYYTPYIFYGRAGNRRTEIKGPWQRIRRAAGLPDGFRFHGLRHAFASALATAGVNLQVIQALLVHKDLSMTQRYAHLQDKALREAADRSGELLKPRIEETGLTVYLEAQGHEKN